MPKQFYVYILTNKLNTVLYIGVTKNLVKRTWEHKEELVPGFTKKYRLKKLVYYEVADTAAVAIFREKQLKNLVRRKKNQLISEFNPTWMDLYHEILSA